MQFRPDQYLGMLLEAVYVGVGILTACVGTWNASENGKKLAETDSILRLWLSPAGLTIMTVAAWPVLWWSAWRLYKKQQAEKGQD